MEDNNIVAETVKTENAEEKTVYSNDDIDLKNSLIEVYTKNYSSLFKCFINKTN